jgi:universal stress protein E
MRAIRRILVAVKDPNARSLPAVEKAARIALGSGASLELFHGIQDKVYVDAVALADRSVTSMEAEMHNAYLERLEKIAVPLRRRGLAVTTTADWDFPACDAIVRRAIRSKADLIVVQAHPAPRRAPWLLRFNDWELLRTSPVPVLIVKNSKLYERPKLLAAVDPQHAYSKPAKLDDEILRTAGLVAEALQGSVHAVHAYLPLPIGLSTRDYVSPDTVARIEAKAAADAEAAFDRTLRAYEISKARRHLVAQHPVAAIPMVATQIGGEIVVMGAISRSGLQRIFIGNTAERLLDRLSCDVLIVKPASFATTVSRARRGPKLVAAPMLPMGA